MKTVLLTVLVVCITQLTIGQCAKSGAFTAVADPMAYPISGTGTLEFLADGSKKVNFEQDFSTVQGVVLHTFLSVDQNYDPGVDLQISSRELYVDEENDIKGSLGNPITGTRSFDVPNTVEFDTYNYVIVYCVSANELWGRAQLANPVGSGCTSLSNNTFTTEELAIFPNPVSDQLNIRLNSLEAASFKIFSLNGQLLQTIAETAATNSQIDVSNLETGLYLIEITNKNKKGFQRLVVN